MLAKRILSVIICGAALIAAADHRVAPAGESADSSKNGSSVAPPVVDNDRGIEKAKWYADPERGWIRVEERDQLQKKASPDRTDSSRTKTPGILWEY